MTPKQKAVDLVKKFDRMGVYHRLCAVIAVEEILNAIDWHDHETPNREIQYWQDVKKEIEAL